MVAAHGLGQGSGQKAFGHIYFRGHGLLGGQLEQGLVSLVLSAGRMPTIEALRHGHAIVARVQQHQLRIERHGQARGIGKGAVGNREKIGQNNKRRHHENENERWEIGGAASRGYSRKYVLSARRWFSAVKPGGIIPPVVSRHGRVSFLRAYPGGGTNEGHGLRRGVGVRLVAARCWLRGGGHCSRQPAPYP